MNAKDVLRASRGGLRGDVLVGDEPIHPVRGPAALLDVRRGGADLGIGQMPRHPPQRTGGEDHVGVDHEHRLKPALRLDPAQAVVDRVRLALATVLAAQGEDEARVLRSLCP